ncbi:hypothetical protein GCM10010393_20110 [Streptomyces gobitricini]|uniref:Transposase n=1 Tax=Streptomyces gobitricini TaxID=68211 RepID=A0ABN3LT96_9ACTN
MAAADGLSLRACLARPAETLLTPAERAERAEKARVAEESERLRTDRRTGAGPGQRAGPAPGPGDRPVSDAMHIVLDDTAMAASDQGTILASRLVHRAHADWFLCAPA